MMSKRELNDMMNIVRRQYTPSEADSERVFRAIIAAPAIPASATSAKTASVVPFIKGIIITSVAVMLSIGVYHGFIKASDNDRGATVAPQKEASRQPSAFIPPEIAVPAYQIPKPKIAVAPSNNNGTSEIQPAKSGFGKDSASHRKLPGTEISHPESAAPADTLALELKLVSGAAAAINKGNPSRAMTLLNRHRTQFPKGIMSEERNGLEIIALCTRGDRDTASVKYRSFKQHSPNAPINMRIKKTCGF